MSELPKAHGKGSLWLPAGIVRVVGILGFCLTRATGLAQLTPFTTAGTWGANSSGVLAPPANLPGVVSAHAGSQHALALTSDGRVPAWGDNSFGQLNVPVELTNAVALAAGSQHNLRISSDGKIFAWGDNSARGTRADSQERVVCEVPRVGGDGAFHRRGGKRRSDFERRVHRVRT
jgi:hypothetical protein